MGSKERKEREKECRRDEILKAGEKLFLEKGLSQTTMDGIAKECELAKGTLYLYFTSKEQLYLTIILRALTVLHDLMAESQKGGGSPIERLARIGDAHFRFYRENPGYFRLLYSSNDTASLCREELQDVGTQIQARNAGIWTIMTTIISDGIKSGIFRKDTDPMEIALSLHCISTMMTMMMAQAPDREEDREKGSCGNFTKGDLQRMMSRSCGRLIYSIIADPEIAKEYAKSGKKLAGNVRKG